MAATEDRPSVVCDAGPLIHLDELQCLELLRDFPSVWVPERVRDEVVRHRSAASFEDLRVVPVKIATSSGFQTAVHAFSLDLGEQMALALALERRPAMVLTDDAAARLAAKALDIRAQGTIGILLRAIRRQQRSREEVVALLEDLPRKSTLHIKRSLLQQIIEEVASGE